MAANERLVMKRPIRLGNLLGAVLMLAGLPLYSVPIDLLEQSYSISGTAFNTVFTGIPFAASRSSSLYLTVIVPSLDQDFFGNTYAAGNAGASSLTLGASVDWRFQGYSIAQMRFRVGASGGLAIVIDATDSGGDANSWLTLQDLTAGTTVLNFARPDLHFHTETLSLYVDSTHEYLLTSIAQGLFGDSASAVATLTTRPVPEACSTILLLGISLAGLAAGLNRYRK